MSCSNTAAWARNASAKCRTKNRARIDWAQNLQSVVFTDQDCGELCQGIDTDQDCGELCQGIDVEQEIVVRLLLKGHLRVKNTGRS